MALFRMRTTQAPEICALYALDVPPSTLRAKFRTQFEKNKAIKDVAVLDVMLLKAQQEYQETMNGWKQVPHIMKWFADEEVSARRSVRVLAALHRKDVPVAFAGADTSLPNVVYAHRHPHDRKASWKSSMPREMRAVDLSARASKPSNGRSIFPHPRAAYSNANSPHRCEMILALHCA